MSLSMEKINKAKNIHALLNGIYTSVNNIVPIIKKLKKPIPIGKSLSLQYGCLIGITGDVKGKLIIAGKPRDFAAIAESMFDMQLDGDMLLSFNGELGNMIAGSFSTILDINGINMDITAPTIIKGNTCLMGYKKAILLSTILENDGEMEVYLLLD